MYMNQVEVSLLSDSEICISQSDEAGDTVSIKITKDQAELVCKWILSAAKATQNDNQA